MQQTPQQSPPQGGNQPLSQQPNNGVPGFWLLVLGALFGYWVLAQFDGSNIEQLSYSTLKQEVRNENIAAVTIKGQEITGFFGNPAAETSTSTSDTTPASEPGATAPQRFISTIPPGGETDLLNLLEQHHVKVNAETTEAAWWAQALVNLLPWLLLIGLIVWSTKQMQARMGGSGGLFGFGKSKAKRFEKTDQTDVSLDQMAGAENAKNDVAEIVDYLKDPSRYRALGANIPHGVLLSGPPGTGKTLLAKAIAGEADVPFFSITGSEFVEMFVGVGASRVRDMFDEAKKAAPAIIFIDELDAIGRARGAGLGGGHDEREQTLNQILSEMDGFDPSQSVVVMAATNRPDVLDPALLRPGRFDRKVQIDLPQREARQQILQVHTRKVPLHEDVDLQVIAGRTIGFSGADLANLVNEASLLAARERRRQVTMDCFDRARDRLLLGNPREHGLTEADQERIAYHEAGHALLAWLLPNADPLEKVTIIPRGQALGATEQMPEEDRVNYPQPYLEDRITGMLGGRLAERLIYGEVSTGAEQDLKEATRLARRMVANWGMSETLGPAYFQRGEEHVFLGKEMGQSKDFSEHTAEVIDRELLNLLQRLESRARELLESHRQALENLVAKLLQHETLQHEEIREVLHTATPETTAKREPAAAMA